MNAHTDQPWLAHKEWRNGSIHSSAGLTWKFMAGFVLVWNLVGFGAAYAVVFRESPNFPDPVYFVLLFPAVGLLLIWQALKHFLEWRPH